MKHQVIWMIVDTAGEYYVGRWKCENDKLRNCIYGSVSRDVTALSIIGLGGKSHGLSGNRLIRRARVAVLSDAQLLAWIEAELMDKDFRRAVLARVSSGVRRRLAV